MNGRNLVRFRITFLDPVEDNEKQRSPCALIQTPPTVL